MRCFSLIFGVIAFVSPIIANGQTPSAQKSSKKFRIAVLACHRQFESSPALVRYTQAEPDLCLWIGDNVYADAPEDPTFIQTCYDALGAKPEFQELMKNRDFMATWDDHDFGLNDAGKDYRFKKESKEMFRAFWNLEEAIPAAQEGIYYARTFDIGGKTLQIIMLDGRYNRDAPDGTGDVLGETQWNWLEKQLKVAANLRILVSGFQILLNKEAGSETWDKFPKAKSRLFETVRKTSAENVIFLTGDQHYGEVSRLPGAMDFDAIELQFAGINQIEALEFNPLRVTPAIYSKHSMALIDLQMDTTRQDIPHLLFRIYDAMADKLELSYRVNLQELNLHLDFSGPFQFAESQKVELKHSYPALQIRYTLDGSEPTANSPIYVGPIVVKKTTVVKARLFTENKQPRSSIFQKTYEKLTVVPAIKALPKLDMGLFYAVYEGNFEKIPAFQDLKPSKTGVAQNFDPKKLAGIDDHYALSFDGYVAVPETGIYEFFTLSDDGSKLYIDGKTVVDNDGSHSLRRRTGFAALEKGLHALRVEFFEDYSGQELRIGFISPSGKLESLIPSQLFHQPKK